MKTRTGKPESARTRILRAAKDLFQRRGYAGTGIAEILAQAGAQKGSLYFHFPDGKEGLAAEAVGEIAADVRAFVDERLEAKETGTQIIEAIATMCARRMAEENYAWSPLISALGAQADRDNPIVAQALTEAYQAWEDQLCHVFRVQGLSKRHATTAARLAVLTLEGAITLTRVRRDAAPLSLVGAVLQEYLDGLAVKPPKTAS